MTEQKSNTYMIPLEAVQHMKPVPQNQFRDYPDVITVQQAAELLCVCKNTVYKLIKEKSLPCRRIGTAIRIRKKDVQLFLRDAS